jgi:hypothetical protein
VRVDTDDGVRCRAGVTDIEVQGTGRLIMLLEVMFDFVRQRDCLDREERD